ncbi:MAG: hypothetical protein J0L97_06140 [Alphaproteobacteria bacterium]|nr:hypothetical protein [Alphaproteobacteria bacterium]
MRFFFLLAAFLTLTSAAHAACIPSGCSGQLCVSDKDGDGGGVVSTCEWRDEYGCYQKFGECTLQKDGKCGWKPTAKLKECLKNPAKFSQR